MTEMGHCRDCRWWDWRTPTQWGDWRRCSRAEYGYAEGALFVVEGDGVVMLSDVSPSPADAHLLAAPDFGCVQFEAKP